jgi:hypothetical protein
MQYELVMMTDDKEIKKRYRSILKMSEDCKIPYHTLKKILDRDNKPNLKYKHTAINSFMEKIKIYKVLEFTNEIKCD